MKLNHIYNGKSEIILYSEIEENSIDLVVTSPPYDNLRTYKDNINIDNFPFEKILMGLYRVMKKGGVVVWVVGDSIINKSESGTSFRQALKFMENGFLLHDTMIYQKNSPTFPVGKNSNRYSQVFEYMFVFSKQTPPKYVKLICDRKNIWGGTYNFGSSSSRNKEGELIKSGKFLINKYSPRFNIWKYNTGYQHTTKDDEAYEHPAIFPEKLAEDHIISWSNEGDTVLDPFSGSGTTLKMAKKLNRKYIGVEISEKYCEIAKKRLNKTIKPLIFN